MESNQPSVDIVIAAHNEEEKIADCLESLLDQDYPRGRFRIIVVDSGSTDSTREIVRRHEVDLVRDSKAGAAHARNLGIAHGSGELIGFLDAHCIAAPEWIDGMTAVFHDRRIGGCQGNTKLEASDARVAHHIGCTRMNEHDRLLEATLRGDLNIYPWMLSGNCMFRRSVLEELGDFDESLPACEDVDISWRAVLAGYLLGYAPGAQVVHWNCDSWENYARKSYTQGRGAAVLARKYLPYGAENAFQPVRFDGDGDRIAIASGYESGYRAEEARLAASGIEISAVTAVRASGSAGRSFDWHDDRRLGLSPETVYWFPDDGTSVIVHNPTRSRIVLDGTADTIWRRMTAGESRNDIAEYLARRYSIPNSTAVADCDEFIQELIASSILIAGRD